MRVTEHHLPEGVTSRLGEEKEEAKKEGVEMEAMEKW